MKYNVIVEPQNGHFRALIPALPHLVAEGVSIEDAVQKMQDVAQQFIARTEVRTIELAMPATPTAGELISQDWLQAAGQFPLEAMAWSADKLDRREAIKRELEIAAALNDPTPAWPLGSPQAALNTIAACRIDPHDKLYQQYVAVLEAEEQQQREEFERENTAAA